MRHGRAPRSIHHMRKTPAPSGSVQRALDAMVFAGHSRDEAAKLVGMLPKSLANALRRASVKQYYAQALEVLRTSERARNIHALTAVRDESPNSMARVAAVKTLEQISDEPIGASVTAARPGVVIIIGTGHSTARELPPNVDVPASPVPANPQIMRE